MLLDLLLLEKSIVALMICFLFSSCRLYIKCNTPMYVDRYILHLYLMKIHRYVICKLCECGCFSYGCLLYESVCVRESVYECVYV